MFLAYIVVCAINVTSPNQCSAYTAPVFLETLDSCIQVNKLARENMEGAGFTVLTAGCRTVGDPA